MSTKIEIFGKKGKIICDAQECQVYLKYNPNNEGFNKGWNSFWLTDQTKPVYFNIRGEEYSEQLNYFIKSINDNNVSSNINSFTESVKTDQVIEMLKNDYRGNNG